MNRKITRSFPTAQLYFQFIHTHVSLGISTFRSALAPTFFHSRSQNDNHTYTVHFDSDDAGENTEDFPEYELMYDDGEEEDEE